MQKQGGLFSVKSKTPLHNWILAAPSSTNRKKKKEDYQGYIQERLCLEHKYT